MIRIDLHVHTRNSPDAFITERQLVTECRRKGIDGVCITDHNTMEGVRALVGNTPLKIVPCEEIRTVAGEIIGLFLKEEIPPGLGIAETIDRIKEQGGLVYLPHPFDELRDSAVKLPDVERVKHQIDIIEVFNARTRRDEYNRAARAYADENELVTAVGSDAHHKWEIGNCCVEMDDFDEAAGFLNSLKNAVYVTRRCPLTIRLYIKFLRIFTGKSGA